MLCREMSSMMVWRAGTSEAKSHSVGSSHTKAGEAGSIFDPCTQAILCPDVRLGELHSSPRCDNDHDAEPSSEAKDKQQHRIGVRRLPFPPGGAAVLVHDINLYISTNQYLQHLINNRYTAF